MVDMKLSLLGFGLMMTVALGPLSIAQEGVPAPGASSSVSERLAWSIQAYAPCEWSTSLTSIETEIASSGASIRQTSDALSSVLRSETACDQVKDAAARLLVRLPEETAPEIVEVVADPELEPEAGIELEPAAELVPEAETSSEPLIASEDEIVAELSSEGSQEDTLEAAVLDVQELTLESAVAEDLALVPALSDLVVEVAEPELAILATVTEDDLASVLPVEYAVEGDISEPVSVRPVDVLDVAFKMTPPPGNPAFAGN